MYNLSVLVTPAIIFSISVLLIKYFGKVIADPSPCTVDKKWEGETAGMLFFFGFILFPIVLALILVFNRNNLAGNSIETRLFIFVPLVVVLSYSFLVKKVIEFRREDKSVIDDKYFCLQVVFYLSSLTILAILIAQYHVQKEYALLILTLIFLFLHLLGAAFFLSLNSNNIVLADVYFIDGCGERPIIGCRIFNINDDSIKLRKENKMIKINKSQILKIEERIGPFLVEGGNFASRLDYYKNILKIR